MADKALRGGSADAPTEHTAAKASAARQVPRSVPQPPRVNGGKDSDDPQGPVRASTAASTADSTAPISTDGDALDRSAVPRAAAPPGAARAAVKPPAAAAGFPLELPSKEQRERLFDRFDYNGNGALSLAEIDKAVLELWPQFNHKPALMRAYRAADVNGDGFIKRREFRLLLKYVVYFNDLWHKFDELDVNHDHRLDLQEFKHGCAMLGISLTDHEAESEFAAMDDNDGGFVVAGAGQHRGPCR
eukprot:COSAG02_NODE_14415_length_1275_cov_1.158163_1_plen_245_part_00